MAQFDVAEAYILQGLEAAHHLLGSVLGEELYGLVHGHLEYVVYVLVVIGHEQCVGLEALAMAGFALEHEVGHKLHLYGNGTLALALFATSSFAIEGKVTCRVAQLLGQGLLGKELAYLVVGLEVGDGVGARRLAYGILVDKLYGFDHADVAL